MRRKSNKRQMASLQSTTRLQDAFALNEMIVFSSFLSGTNPHFYFHSLHWWKGSPFSQNRAEQAHLRISKSKVDLPDKSVSVLRCSGRLKPFLVECSRLYHSGRLVGGHIRWLGPSPPSVHPSVRLTDCLPVKLKFLMS